MMEARGQHSRESGFALLFVFLMAAAIAISLYMELPRVSFEAQRIREQTLIDRGEQYQRAIQLYFRKFKRYPPDLDALENTNNLRFLRKRYRDPMTGGEEWRLIHMGPGGVLTDSLVHQPSQKEEAEKSVNTFITEGPAIGSPATPSSTVSAVPMRRPSEGGAPYPPEAVPGTPGSIEAFGQLVPPEGQPQPGIETSPGVQPEPGFETQTGVQQAQPGDQPQPEGQPLPGFAPMPQAQYPQQTPGQPAPWVTPQTVPGQVSPAPGQPFPFLQQQSGQTQPGIYPQPTPGQPFPFPQQPGGQPSNQPPFPFPPQPVPGLPVPYSQPVVQQPGSQFPASQQPGVVVPVPSPAQPGSSSGPVSAPQPGQNPAVELIRKLLTSPNPRGLAAIQQQGGAAAGPQIGAGIAGVASKLEAEGIKVYNERTKYNEWEFIYDYRTDRMNASLLGATGPAAAGQPQPSPQGTVLAPPGATPGPQPGLMPQPQGPPGPRRRTLRQ